MLEEIAYYTILVEVVYYTVLHYTIVYYTILYIGKLISGLYKPDISVQPMSFLDIPFPKQGI